jgi:hypothetical protein
MEYCCDVFKDMTHTYAIEYLEEGNKKARIWGDKKDAKTGYHIMDDEFDEPVDDDGEFPLKFCPWCSAKL